MYRFDVSSLKPQVAKPHVPDNVVDIDVVVGTKIDQAVIGSCANGRLEDLEVVARILKGRKVHPDVRFIVVPGSRHVWLEALRRGYIEIFQEANAVIGNANCGPCANLHQGILSPEKCASRPRRGTSRAGWDPEETSISGRRPRSQPAPSRVRLPIPVHF